MADEPIIQIFVSNYLKNGSIASGESVMQNIPVEGDPVLYEPKVKNEMGKSGSFEFKMVSTSPFYDSLLQMRTIMRVTYYGTTIFRGRVLTIDKGFDRVRSVHCEGDFSFFLDTLQAGRDDDSRPKLDLKDYIKYVIDQHNSDVGKNSKKRFTIGEMPSYYKNATSGQRLNIPDEKRLQQFGSTSWGTTMDRIEDLVSEFGGYFRTRYDDKTGTTYLDWLDNYFNGSVNPQTIEVSKNLISLEGATEVDNLFTIVIPIGKSDSDDLYITEYWPTAKKNHSKVRYFMVPEIVDFYTDAQLNQNYHKADDYRNAVKNFGHIWKTVEFSNADTTEKLFRYTLDWIKNNFMPELIQWTVGALDMKILDSSSKELLVGDRVKVVHPEVDTTDFKTLTVIAVEMDLFNPENNKYTIGAPNAIINLPYGVSSSTSSSSGSTSKSGGSSSNKTPKDKGGGDEEAQQMQANASRQYYLKKSGKDITLDNSLSYLVYNDKGQKRSAANISKDLSTATRAFSHTKITKFSTLVSEANKRGCKWDDPDLVLEYTPSEKKKQTSKKAKIANNYIQSGVPANQVDYIMNETAGQSWFANLVDDDGNWTEEALNKGASTWSSEIKDTCIKSRAAFNGTQTEDTAQTSTTMQLFSGVSEWLTGTNLNVGDNYVKYTSFDYTKLDKDKINPSSDNALDEYVNNNFNVGTVFKSSETEDSSEKKFKINSNTAEVDGEEGNASFGKDDDSPLPEKRQITINKPITYSWTDDDGNTHTSKIEAGEIALDDLHVTKRYNSLYAELALCDELIAKRATILELVAMKANISELISDSITTKNLKTKLAGAEIANLGILTCGTITATTSLNILGSGNRPVSLGNAFVGCIKSQNGNDITLTFSRPNGTELKVTFDKGDTEAAYNEGWNACIDAAEQITNAYTRSATGGGGSYGGNNYEHYVKYQSSTANLNVGSGWYQTSYISDAYRLPDRK